MDGSSPTYQSFLFILDRSGSMKRMVESAISGFNRLLREPQQAVGTARFTLVLFDDRFAVSDESHAAAKGTLNRRMSAFRRHQGATDADTLASDEENRSR